MTEKKNSTLIEKLDGNGAGKLVINLIMGIVLFLCCGSQTLVWGGMSMLYSKMEENGDKIQANDEKQDLRHIEVIKHTQTLATSVIHITKELERLNEKYERDAERLAACR